MPLKVVIKRETNLKTSKKENRIIIYFVKIFNIKFNIDKFLNKIIPENSIILEVIESGILVYKFKNTLRTFFKFTLIDKITLLYKIKSINTGILAYNSIYYLRMKLNQYFIGVDNEYYNVSLCGENSIDFEINFYTRFLYIILSILFNIKDLFKLKKKKGSEINVRTSN